jgi:hypothetical protein
VAIHPSVLPEIIRWFSDPDRNPYGAQLWMEICPKVGDGCHQAAI